MHTLGREGKAALGIPYRSNTLSALPGMFPTHYAVVKRRFITLSAVLSMKEKPKTPTRGSY